MKYILFDGRAEPEDPGDASVLEAFEATDDKAALKQARQDFPRQGAVLFKCSCRETEFVAYIDQKQ